MPKQDHLVCFLAGLLMHGASGPAARDWQTGVALLDTCIDTYASSKTGLGAEIVFFPIPGQAPIDHRDWRIDKRTPANPHPLDGRYILRPETVESIFFAYRLTGEQRYRCVKAEAVDLTAQRPSVGHLSGNRAALSATGRRLRERSRRRRAPGRARGQAGDLLAV